MSATTILQQMQAVNERYRAGHAELMDAAGAFFLVLACIDPRLTGFLEPALGLPRNRALVIRTAGNRVDPANHDVIRSIAAAVYIRGASEIFVTGHTDCAMACFSSAQVVEAFRKAGVARTAFGDDDLRQWFGAFSDIKGNVAESVHFLRRCPCLPRSVKVHGIVLNLADASLDVIENGDLAPPEAASALTAEQHVQTPVKAESSEGRASEQAPLVQPVPPLKGRPVVIPEERAAVVRKAEVIPAPQTMMDAIIALREIFVAERRDPHMKRQLAEISSLARRERNPARVFTALEAAVKDSQGRYPQLPGILDFLRASLEAQGAGSKFSEFIRRITD